MAVALQFVLNGRIVRIENFSPNTTLLEFLRGTGLTGGKEGCAEGDCGACSVVMVDRDTQGRPCYRAINSCLVPLCLMAGREIVSVEGIASGQGLHPVQRKMVECHGSQCGYCTPGFIMSLFEGYYRDDIHKHDELDDQLSGNLCRCTGYRPIRDAAIEAFAFRSSRRKSAQNKTRNQSEQTDVCCYEDTFAERLKKADVKPGAAEYEFAGEKFFRPTSLAELLRLRKENPDARLIAGATELGLDITKRYKKFPTLISVEAVPELREIKSTETEWHIGAATTLTQIEEKMAEEFPALGDMLRVFGSRQIRNRATMGGNLVTASPIGDSAPVLLALDAKVVLVSSGDAPSLEGGSVASTPGNSRDGGVAATALRRGVAATPLAERVLPINEFFVAYRKTALQTGEILKAIIVPRGISKPGLTRKCSWFKVSKRREMDISTVAACFTVDLDKQNVVRHALLAYGGVAAMPARAKKTESALLGKVWSEETIEIVLPILRTEFTPISDVRGSAHYRSGLVTSLLEKFFHNSEGRVTRVPDSDENNLGLAELVPPKNANRPPPHESGHKHVTGEAVYTDDQLAGKNVLEVWPVCAPHARAWILKRDATAARQLPGIQAVLLAEDIPGLNDVGTKHDEILLADKEVLFHGHMVALVVGETQEACRAAAEKVVVEYEPLPHILTLRQALAEKSFHNEPNFIRRGNCDDTLANAPSMLEGEFELGGQEHFYLETQAAWAERGEDGSMLVVSSTQHPSEVQSVVARVLNVPANKVVVQSPRMGGGFGGKETQAATPAALAALAARHTGQPVRVRWNRDQDMILTGHRHPFLARFKAGFDKRGMLLAARIHLFSNGGWSLDLSQAITDRALFHLDNAYYIPAVEFRGQVAKTNLSSNTAFRGFGGPQGMLVMEEILDRVARRLGLPPEMIRERNLYRGKGETNTTPYGQEIGDNRLQTIWHELKQSAQLEQRRREIAKWNAAHSHSRRGIAMTPVKFGISFTVTHLNQAGALVLIYQDGTVQVNHGGTEMGQGIHTNVAAIAAKELGVKPEQIRVMPTSTDKVPNTSATAASAGTDLNGAAVKNACEILKARLIPIAQELLKKKSGREPKLENISFANGEVFDSAQPQVKVPFADVVKKAYLARVSLSATGYYATPGIHYDRAEGRGRPFHYFANGAAVTEVEVDGFTGMHRVLRVDILHDVGDSVNEGVNRGQIEGGFVQGLGWLTTEELQWNDEGQLLTHSPDTYKIPSVGDTPQIFNVTLLKNATQKNVIHGSKAVGEPPLMLAISVREAIRDAVAAFGPAGREVPLAVPATCEAIWFAIQKVKAPNSKLQHPEKLQTSSSQKKRVSV
jgi:xanthine dehydrogenase molybdopterin binding subunit/xanthine dehydrogenase small subunit